jgi:hypothetical protein
MAQGGEEGLSGIGGGGGWTDRWADRGGGVGRINGMIGGRWINGMIGGRGVWTDQWFDGLMPRLAGWHDSDVEAKTIFYHNQIAKTTLGSKIIYNLWSILAQNIHVF